MQIVRSKVPTMLLFDYVSLCFHQLWTLVLLVKTQRKFLCSQNRSWDPGDRTIWLIDKRSNRTLPWGTPQLLHSWLMMGCLIPLSLTRKTGFKAHGSFITEWKSLKKRSWLIILKVLCVSWTITYWARSFPITRPLYSFHAVGLVMFANLRTHLQTSTIT